jgi:hypothetical protein
VAVVAAGVHAPGMVDRCAKVVALLIGSASMSARRPIARRAAVAHHADHAGAADAAMHLDAERSPELARHELGGAVLLEGELGVAARARSSASLAVAAVLARPASRAAMRSFCVMFSASACPSEPVAAVSPVSSWVTRFNASASARAILRQCARVSRRARIERGEAGLKFGNQSGHILIGALARRQGLFAACQAFFKRCSGVFGLFKTP